MIPGIFLERSENMKNIIAGYRKMTGMKQSDMAKIFGISRQSYWNKETGRTPFTDKEKTLFKKEVAKIMPSITISDIFFKDEVGK